MRLNKRVMRWLGFKPRIEQSLAKLSRDRVDHVIIFDGTMSSLKPGSETNAGLTYNLLREMAPSKHLSLRYECGVQWQHWRNTWDVMTGNGINRQIRRAYGVLASRYRPGDRIFLLGFSRGAYAARSMAGMIDQVGLLKHQQANVRNIRQIYRQYECSSDSDAERQFAEDNCHDGVEIEMIGVWDTVKALGFRPPVIWRWIKPKHMFHNHHLGDSIRHGFHALAMDETRAVFSPVMWQSRDDWSGVLEQVWFRGCHSDIGGNLGEYEAARPLANIPLVWMLDKMQGCGLPLPADYHERFSQSVDAPSVGSYRGWSKLFLWRKRRMIGADQSEKIHTSAQNHRYAIEIPEDSYTQEQN
jgi:uncharacterized protein (DUF2235 family)